MGGISSCCQAQPPEKGKEIGSNKEPKEFQGLSRKINTVQKSMNKQASKDYKSQNSQKTKEQLAAAQKIIKKLQQIIKGQELKIKQQAMEIFKLQQEVKRARQSRIISNQNAQQVVLIQMQKYEQLQRQRMRQMQQKEKRLSQIRKSLQQKQLSIQVNVKARCEKEILLIKHQQSKKYQSLKIRFDNREQQLTQLKIQNARIIQNSVKLQAGASNNAGKMAEYEQLMAKLQRQLQQQKSQSNQKTQQIELMRFSQLFQNQIFSGRQFYKQYLTGCIQERYNRRVVKTRHLYSYDQNNKISFHKSIDEIPNILVVVRLLNSFYVAGFTQSPFIPKVASNGDALLISLTNKRVFYLVEQNRKGITYDDYYIIFGNSELRLRSQQNKIFSNFGISNGYFSNRGETVNILLGEGTNRQIDIQYYEIYQVIFEAI